MTPDELEEFFVRCPSLYHMAQAGSWPKIQQYGLLCTNRLLDLLGVEPTLASELTSKRRPHEVLVSSDDFGSAIVRDQIPLLDSDLEVCLLDGLTPTDWHRFLNERVFFWTNEERLFRLTGAGAYRERSHDVLTLDTRAVFERFGHNIELSPINSGCTRPWRHKRGKDTFLPIAQYPYDHWRKRRKKNDVVAEVTILGGAEPIADLVVEVRRMKRTETEHILYKA